MAEPLLALFLTIALGYLVGKLKAGKLCAWRAIAGTLLVGVVIGQFGVEINSGIKSIFFALFIYAVGFQGGPQFFHALNRRSLNQLVFRFSSCVSPDCSAYWQQPGCSIWIAAWRQDSPPVVSPSRPSLGTAGDAIGKLGLTPDLTKMMQTNVAVGYAPFCYIFRLARPNHHGELVSCRWS